MALEKLALVEGDCNFSKGSFGPEGERNQMGPVNRFLEFNRYRTNPNIVRQPLAEWVRPSTGW